MSVYNTIGNITNSVLIGDCKDVLKSFEDGSIDCIVTDPPYGYSFMNKNWDKALPSLEALKECCRVLKSGAFAFFMSAPRQDVLSRMILRLEEAGFDTGFTSIYWCYASGFPKAANVGKQLDKKRVGDKFWELRAYLRDVIKQSNLTQKEIKEHLGYPLDSGVIGHWIGNSQPCTPSGKDWLKLKLILPIDDRYDSLILEAEREVIGKGSCGDPATWYAGGKSEKLEYDITAPSTDKAKEFDGSYAGFQPKPAVEIIIVVMKPLTEKTYVDQCLNNGKGVTWLGDCRIPYKSDLDIWKDNEATGLSKVKSFGNEGTVLKKSAEPEGRFPANLLVSDDCLNDGTITKYQGGLANTEKSNSTDIYKFTDHKRGFHPGDSGSFSRYFDLDAWFKSKLPEQAQKTYPYLIVPKPAKSEKNKYCENKHPTVKPLKLMSYLITMGSREGDVILDPFAGSGTTLEACKLLNRVFIGIDSDPGNEKYMRARGQLDEVTLETFTEA